MSDSTANYKNREKFFLSDILSARDCTARPYRAIDCNIVGDYDVDAFVVHHKENHTVPEIVDYEHALGRVRMRELGKSDLNGTAHPSISHNASENSSKLSRIESRIRQFLSYTKDWDGDGAEDIPMAAIYSSLNFLDEAKRRFSGKEPESAAPSPDGEIVLYWHNSNGYAEVNFDRSGQVTLCWGDEENDIQVVEESDENVSNFQGNRVWGALSDILEKNF
jgi:hypothetical protein